MSLTSLGRIGSTLSTDPLISLLAGADLRNKEGYAIKLDGSGDAIVASVKGETVLGILHLGGNTGEQVTVAISGRLNVKAGAVLSKGAEVEADNGGKVIAIEATKQIVGVLLQASLADGDMVECALNLRGYKPA